MTSLSELFGEHPLDFSNSEVSGALLITLYFIEDVHIIKPTHVALEKEVAMDALADSSYHHPVVWDHLLKHAVDQGLFDEESSDTVFTMETCLDLLKFLSIPDGNSSVLSSCTLLEAAAIYHEKDVIGGLLSFFKAFDVCGGSIEPLPRLLITIIHFLVLDSENSPMVDSICLLGECPHMYSTFIYKHRLLEIALCVIIRGMNGSAHAQLSFFQHESHIKDLHNLGIIRGICVSIVQSSFLPQSILLPLASIAPDHPEWPKILTTLHSPDAKYSADKYKFTLIDPGHSEISMKKDLKEVVNILTEYVMEAKNEFNQASRSSSPHIEPKALCESCWSKWRQKLENPHTDVEEAVV
ncbi:hypothetical protein EDD18DRAFT_1409195 [Armillaria luteobubalina]|uniref:Uncharacterized protein n=1 Tax=Armillaria luteobubalina TaxID=153913 RepID=A0AA39PZ54_9AGAR|nr:hypothetical protein EDD18DRAFT_1409195 [Armillaria luteobubalina]